MRAHGAGSHLSRGEGEGSNFGDLGGAVAEFAEDVDIVLAEARRRQADLARGRGKAYRDRGRHGRPFRGMLDVPEKAGGMQIRVGEDTLEIVDNAVRHVELVEAGAPL